MASPALKKKVETAREDRFFAASGDLFTRPAKLNASMAMAIFQRSPEAHAAFNVHAAGARLANGGGKIEDHYYAVLGLAAPLDGRPTRETREAIKRQHRLLSDTLDPAKSSGSAVAAAYNLVNEAFAALTETKKNEQATVAAAPRRFRS